MTGFVPNPVPATTIGGLAGSRGPVSAGQDEGGGGVVDEAAVEPAQRVGDDAVGEVAVEVERFPPSASGVRRANARAAIGTAPSCSSREPELVAVALGQHGEVDGLAEVAERHLERRLGRVLGVDAVRPELGVAEAEAVVADDDVGEAGVERQDGELHGAEHAGAGDRRVGAEAPVARTDGDGDLVGAGPRRASVCASLVKPSTSARVDAGVVEGAADGVDDEAEDRAVVLPGRVGSPTPTMATVIVRSDGSRLELGAASS